MDKLYRRYTIIAWFFTLNIAWLLLDDFVLRKWLFHSVRTSYGKFDEPRFSVGVTLVYTFISYAIQIAWCVVLALLAWTARNDYLSRTNNPGALAASVAELDAADE